MSLLTKVVKSIAVVDDRPPPGMKPATGIPPPPAATVIKRNAATAPEAPWKDAPRPRQGYVDELNRIRVEIAQAKAELRTIRRELEEAVKNAAAAQAASNTDTENADIAKAGQLELARQEAEQILENARAEAAAIHESAQNQGYLEGFSKGFDEAKAEYTAENGPAVHRLQQMLEALGDYQHQLVEESESGLVDLAIGIARRVIGRELSTDPTVVTDMLYGVLDANRREEFIKISIAKDLMPVEAKASEEVRTLLMRANANVQLLADIDLEPGGCVVETPKGYTDVSISTQLNNLSVSLKEA